MYSNLVASVIIATYIVGVYAQTSLFKPSGDKKAEIEACINLGSRGAVGPFKREGKLIKYLSKPRPGLQKTSSRISNTRFQAAYQKQIRSSKIVFSLKVNPAHKYIVTLGFAETEKKFCGKQSREYNISVQGRKLNKFNVFKKGGCEAVVLKPFEIVKPNGRGEIKIEVREASRKVASIATVCVLRQGGPTVPSRCREAGCVNLEGPIKYLMSGTAYINSECKVRRESQIKLQLPGGAKVKNAVLYWGANGNPGKSTSIIFNGKRIVAEAVYSGSETFIGDVFRAYGAQADVTGMVKKSGLYKVTKMFYDRAEFYCSGSYTFGGWTLNVIYEKKSLPMARINMCLDKFRHTGGDARQFSIKCLKPHATSVKARTSLLILEGDGGSSSLSINGKTRGSSIFDSATAPGVDILNFDVSSAIASGAQFLKYAIDGVDWVVANGAIVYQTL